MRMQLTITLNPTPEPCDIGILDEAPCRVEFSAAMEDANVHAWFEIFEQVLRCYGFNERVIANGACQMAFNPRRDPQLMRTVYNEFDLGEFHQEQPVST